MATPKLFHVSEEKDLVLFRPRPAPTPQPDLTRPVIWAVDEEHLPNYLLPRDCPRICFAPGDRATPEDRLRFTGNEAATRVIVVEDAWRDRIEACRLFVYEFPVGDFRLHDVDAGYWLASADIRPIDCVEIGDVVAEILGRGAELRFQESLWAIRDAIMRSSLVFSIIRMRNAQPRPDA